MDSEGSKKFKQFQGYLKGKKWNMLRQFLDRTPIGIPEFDSGDSATQVSAGIAQAMEFARSLIDAMIEMIDAGAGSTQSIHEVRHYCEKLFDNGAVSVATRVLQLFSTDPRIVGRAATLLRLLCQMETGRNGIGEEGIVCQLVISWSCHKDCIPLIEALVTLTSSHMDNISHALRSRAMRTAIEIIDANPLAVSTRSSSKAVVSSSEKLIDLTTRVVAMCSIHTVQKFAGESPKQQKARIKEMSMLTPKLFQVLQTAIALGSRNIIINLMSALANISDCHIKNGCGLSLDDVNAEDVVNLIVQGWTLFKADEHVMTIAVWALTAYTTVCPQALRALKFNCCSALHNLAKPWKGFVTVDFLCEKAGPVTKFSRFNRSLRKSRNSPKAPIAVVDVADEKPSALTSIILHEEEMEQETVSHPEIPDYSTNGRDNHVSASEIFEKDALISTSTRKQELSNEEEIEGPVRWGEKDQESNDEVITNSLKRSARSSPSPELFEEDHPHEKEENEEEAIQEELYISFDWDKVPTKNSSQQMDGVARGGRAADYEMNLELEPQEKVECRKQPTRSSPSADRPGRRVPRAAKGQERGNFTKSQKAAVTPEPVIVISDGEFEEDGESEAEYASGVEHESEAESEFEAESGDSNDVRNVRNKRRGQAKAMTPGVRRQLVNKESDDDFRDDDSSMKSMSSEESEEEYEEASGRRRSARLQTRTRTKTSFDSHLGMYGRSAYVSLDKKRATRSAPRPVQRRVKNNTRKVDITESEGHRDETYISMSPKTLPVEVEVASPKPASKRQVSQLNNYQSRQRGVASAGRKQRVMTHNDIHVLIGEDENTRTSFDDLADDEDECDAPDMEMSQSPTPASSAEKGPGNMIKLSAMMQGLANLDENALRSDHGLPLARREGVKRRLEYEDILDEGLSMRPVKQQRR